MSDHPEDNSTQVEQTAAKDLRAGRDLNIGNITQIGTLVQQFLHKSEQQELKAQDRRNLLNRVKNDVKWLLKQSLYESKRIDLIKYTLPQQVDSLMAKQIKRSLRKSERLSPETKIIDVFNEQALGKLLILGSPGGGKTIALLELAEQLVTDAENVPEQPIPVLLNLATWKAYKQTIDAWIVTELKSKYGVRTDIAQQWIKQRQLLPLLDELDRLNAEHQEACIKAINDWLQKDNQPKALVVCSRLQEYRSSNVRLKLEGAVCLGRLTKSQIREYLEESIARQVDFAYGGTTACSSVARHTARYDTAY
ncbi:MAG: NACHT domain-containing protein [Cyanobacteriota bacterium]